MLKAIVDEAAKGGGSGQRARGEHTGHGCGRRRRVSLRQTPAEARAQIQAMAKKGIRHTAEIGLTPEPGYTTILLGGSNMGADAALRDKIEKGEYNGPRIIPSERPRAATASALWHSDHR